MLGCGSVGQCALPLVRRHIDMPADRITVMDFEDVRPKIEDSLQAGVGFKQARLTQENYTSMLGELVGPGDIIIDLSWNVETFDMLDWCGEHDVRYLNTSLEEWDPYGDIENKSPYERSLYSRQMRIRLLKDRLNSQASRRPTAIIDHGANPGLVSHFTKRALLEIATTMLEKRLPAATGVDKRGVREADRRRRGSQVEGSFARLSQATGTKVIHISERDTQVSSQPKAMNEFVNTWSIEGFYEEGTAPAELGWGTHERRLPKNAHTPDRRTRQSDLSRPAGHSDVRALLGPRRRTDHRDGRPPRRVVHASATTSRSGKTRSKGGARSIDRPCTTPTCPATTRF